MRVKYGGISMKRHHRWTMILIIFTVLFFGLRFFFELSSIGYRLSSWLLLITLISFCLLWINAYRKQISHYMISNLHVMIFVVALLLLELFFTVKNMETIQWTYPFSLGFSITLWVFLIMFTPKKHQLFWFILSLVFYGIYVLGQDVYVRIFHDFFSFKEAATLREGLESGESMYRFNVFHAWVCVVLATSIYLMIKKRSEITQRDMRIAYKPLLYVLLFLFVGMNITSQIPRKQQSVFISDYYLYRTLYVRKQAAMHFSMMHVLGLDLYDTLTPIIKTKNDVTRVEQYFDAHEKPLTSHAFTGLFEHKNVVFILAESYDEIALDEYLTPHLYKLKQESISFENHYTPVYPRTTSDTEFIINTGLIPSLEDGPTISAFKHNTYSESLANLFNDKGYTTQAFHANYKEFYQRHIIYKHYGFNTFYGQHELGLSDNSRRFDTEFFKAIEPLLYHETPFLNFIITFSGHSPYTMSHEVARAHYPFVKALYPNDDDVINYYRATQVELDLMIEQLFISLETHGHSDDTIIVLMGDHYPYTMPQDIYSLYNPVSHAYEKQRGNFYVWSKDNVPYSVQKLTSSFDVLPTLVSLFNLSNTVTHYIGHDAFSPVVTPVLFKDYSYFNGYEHIKLYDITVYDLEAKHIAELYQISKKILRTNYFNRGA